jgi:hypothetical protein
MIGCTIGLACSFETKFVAHSAHKAAKAPHRHNELRRGVAYPILMVR